MIVFESGMAKESLQASQLFFLFGRHGDVFDGFFVLQMLSAEKRILTSKYVIIKQWKIEI